MSFNSQLSSVQAAQEDFEWYPTTNEILEVVAADINKYCTDNYGRNLSILDIGAGNGKVLTYIQNKCNDVKRFFAIEKSHTHIQSLPPEIMMMGCDFEQISLIGKEVSIIFCNPPYSIFPFWVEKIIEEASCNSRIYLVIPQRWRDNKGIQSCIFARNIKVESLGEFDFENAEDRKARAKVEIVVLTFKRYEKNSPFEAFFEANFSYPEPKEKTYKEKEEDRHELAEQNFVKNLLLDYHRQMDKLRRNYEAVCQIDYDILQEFAITKHHLVASLNEKLKNLKKVFWQKLFDGMEEIKRRLTQSSRNDLLRQLNDYTGIEFNHDNILAVVIWVIKNANLYLERQFIETYEKMFDLVNIENYKSNQRVFTKDQFGYRNRYYNSSEEATHFRLKVGNRIVLGNRYSMGLKKDWFNKNPALADSTVTFLNDIITIGDNLGFKFGGQQIYSETAKDSSAFYLYCSRNDKKEILAEVRAFFNGNMHVKFLNDFVHAINIQYGKLKGWLPNKEAVAVEMPDVPQDQVEALFAADMSLKMSNFLALN